MTSMAFSIARTSESNEDAAGHQSAKSVHVEYQVVHTA